MADMPDPSSFFERLIDSSNREVSMFLPFILAFTSDISMPDSDSDSDFNPDNRGSENPDRSRDRIILINPSQGMLVIEGRSSSSLDSLLRDLMSNKDGQPPASTASIEALPRVEIKEGDDDGKCVICLEEWGIGDVAREMPCKHRFHGDCVEKWLKVHGTCPVCRYRMPVDDDLGKKIESDQTVESNERENEGRGRGIWVSFSIRNEEESRSQSGSSDDFS